VLEREAKLTAPPSFRLPRLGGLAAGVEAVPVAPRRLWAIYYDSDDLRLTRWRASLRRRTGEGWTVKLPVQVGPEVLAREEVRFPGPPGRPPEAAVDLVRAYLRTAPPHPQARLWTFRRRVELRDDRGRVLAEVVDDEVAVLRGRRIAARFRELEVETAAHAPRGLLETVAARLREAGAVASVATPKVARALGPRASEPPDVTVPELPPGARAGDLARRAIAASVARLIQHDPGMRLGRDPDDLRQARAAVGRLRADLRAFRGVLEPEWVARLQERLAWLAGGLGTVGDRGVAPARPRRQAELLAVLRDPRYVALLDWLVEAANGPVLPPVAQSPAAAPGG
jgi:inorganic triphosphatase YgiF